MCWVREKRVCRSKEPTRGINEYKCKIVQPVTSSKMVVICSHHPPQPPIAYPTNPTNPINHPNTVPTNTTTTTIPSIPITQHSHKAPRQRTSSTFPSSQIPPQKRKSYIHSQRKP